MNEVIIEQADAVFDETIVNKWIQIKRIDAITCQKIELERELINYSNSEDDFMNKNKKKQNKKTKAQKKQDWQTRQANLSTVEPKMIEIIKPEIIKPDPIPKKDTNVKNVDASKNVKIEDGREKNNKKKKN